MKGGTRLKSGRKAIPDINKKKQHQIYISNNEYNLIIKYGVGKSFSEKSRHLIDYAIDKKSNSVDTIKFIDLFAGMGGIRIGFSKGLERAGIKSECIFSSEIKDHAINVYHRYFNEKKIYGDITKIESNVIPDFDFLLAGFPCQPFSSAGKGLGFEDTRGTLFFDIARIIKEKKPYGFLLENVEGLVNHANGKTLSTILDVLEKLNYKVTWKILNAKNFGIPQSRVRIYIVGTKDKKVSLDNLNTKETILNTILEKGISYKNSNFVNNLLNHYPIENLAGKSIKDKRGGKNNIHSWDIEIKGETSKDQRKLLSLLLKERRKKKWAELIGIQWMDGMPLTLKQIQTFFNHNELKKLLDDLVKKGYLSLEYPKKMINNTRVYDTKKPKGYNIVAGKLSFEFSQILDPKGVSPTLVATDVSKLGVIDSQGIRQLTIRECLRLCGYPEDYDVSTLSKKQVFDLIGNTVCVPVIEEISYGIAINTLSKNRIK